MELIQSKLLQGLSNIKHGFFRPGLQGRHAANLSFKNGAIEAVQVSRVKACQLAGIEPKHLTHVYQDHGTDIWNVTREHRGAGALTGEGQMGVGDAMITTEPGIPLAILIADCLPLFFSSRDGQVVGIAHAGWRGTVDNLAGKMVDRFDKDYNVAPQELRVWIGPGISSCCFAVKEDVWGAFADLHKTCSWGFNKKTMKIDLKTINRHQLWQAGVLKEAIEISPDCTCCQQSYFSYRREGPGFGHNMALIQLR
ncbi:peptidoglycan editing factor PgeF [bacterium]|nr:peptidoglycan editing factor PgeF [bacterium]